MEIRNLRMERNCKHGKEFPSDTKTSQVFFRYMTLASFPFAQLLAFYRKTSRILPLTSNLQPVFSAPTMSLWLIHLIPFRE